MCVGRSRTVRVKEPEYKNRPVTVTGEQIGVENPIDTAEVTEQLRIQRQKKEGTYVDPNLMTSKLLSSFSEGNPFQGGSKGGQREKSLRSARLRSGVSRGPNKGGTKAQKAAAARMKSKFKSSPTGRQTGVA